MKRVIVNGRFLIHKITGVERYAREILLELDKIIQPGEIELAVPPETKEIPNYKNIRVRKVGRLNNRLWEHISFPLYVKRQHAVSLNLCNIGPLPSPDITCIFDMKIQAHPEFFSNKFVLWYKLIFLNAINRGKMIITDSETAKKDILKYYPHIDPQKIKVIYPAWQHFARIGYDEETLKKYHLSINSFYFAMGSMDPNKNFKWIAETAVNNPTETFAVAGSMNENVFSKELEVTIPDNMKFLGYVSDEEAKTLMRDCKAFLFPSIYEGFGIPPLEAMSAGCKSILVSDTEVMHEIFDHSVEYINIDAADSKLIGHSCDCSHILNKFSWQQSAKALLNLLET